MISSDYKEKLIAIVRADIDTLAATHGEKIARLETLRAELTTLEAEVSPAASALDEAKNALDALQNLPV